LGELRQSDFDTVSEQLGRDPTTPFSVVVRCWPDPHPLVIRNHPIDADGAPFPTLFWLTCPEAVRAVARVESGGEIARLNQLAEEDAGFARDLEAAHAMYAAERARLVPEAEAFGGVGGTRTGVKCLHAHYAFHLAGGQDPVGAQVAAQVEPIHAPACADRVAAIDQGTNSIRLLIADPLVGGGMQELARDMVITRLGRGVDATGRLAPEALARTTRVLETYCRRAAAMHVRRIRMAATSAVRDASNREELESVVLAATGASLEVLSGNREAELSFLGAARGLDRPVPLCVLDIGGGSTEFVVGDREPRASISTQMGSVRLTERLVTTDPISAEDRDAVCREIDRVLEEVQASVPIGDAATLVAVAGTATTVQAMSMDLPRYDPDAIHRTELAVEEAERVLGRLAAMTTPERAALPFMARGRADVIVAGAMILVRVMRRWGFPRAVVSEEDILDGLAAEMLPTQ